MRACGPSEALPLPPTQGFRQQPSVIQYDHLVLALGNVTDFRGLRGLPECAIPFKNLSDALYIRNHVIHALEEAAIEHEDSASIRANSGRTQIIGVGRYLCVQVPFGSCTHQPG